MQLRHSPGRRPRKKCDKMRVVFVVRSVVVWGSDVILSLELADYPSNVVGSGMLSHQSSRLKLSSRHQISWVPARCVMSRPLRSLRCGFFVPSDWGIWLPVSPGTCGGTCAWAQVPQLLEPCTQVEGWYVMSTGFLVRCTLLYAWTDTHVENTHQNHHNFGRIFSPSSTHLQLILNKTFDRFVLCSMCCPFV